MSTPAYQYQWDVICGTIQGAQHSRQGRPNQDAIAWKMVNGAQVLLAVSDGHGGAAYVRSDQGARIAVETAITVLDELLATHDPQARSHLVRDHLPQRLVREWQHRVTEHAQTHPWTEPEQTVLKRLDAATRDRLKRKPWVAYGTTLLAVVITPEHLIYLQLGDGDILVVSAKEEIYRPIPPDPRCFANETPSLCGNNAWLDMHVQVHPLTHANPEAIPALILVATDGYKDSFRDPAGFDQVGRDLLARIRHEYGLTEIKENLDRWLTETSVEGSGDDITVGLIYRRDIVPQADRASASADPSDGETVSEPIPEGTHGLDAEETEPSAAVDEPELAAGAEPVAQGPDDPGIGGTEPPAALEASAPEVSARPAVVSKDDDEGTGTDVRTQSTDTAQPEASTEGRS